MPRPAKSNKRSSVQLALQESICSKTMKKATSETFIGYRIRNFLYKVMSNASATLVKDHVYAPESPILSIRDCTKCTQFELSGSTCKLPMPVVRQAAQVRANIALLTSIVVQTTVRGVCGLEPICGPGGDLDPGTQRNGPKLKRPRTLAQLDA